jgi:hypothetical protein
MGAKKINPLKLVVSNAISKLDEREKAEVRDWAEKSLVVINDKKLSKTNKLKKLKRIKRPKATKHFLAAILEGVKSALWDNQSWARRLAVAGLALGVVTFGTEAAGVAALGGAIGVPLALLTGTGAALLGLIIDEINKETKKRR